MEDDRYSLLDVCKRAATRLNIECPKLMGSGSAEMDWYDGRKLPSRTAPSKQLLPAIPACIAEAKRNWDKPSADKVQTRIFASMNLKDMGELGLGKPSVVEPSLANHLKHSSSSLTGTSLPGKREHFFMSIYQKVYMSTARPIWQLNVTTILLVYQTDLMLKMHNLLAIKKPNPDQFAGTRAFRRRLPVTQHTPTPQFGFPNRHRQ